MLLQASYSKQHVSKVKILSSRVYPFNKMAVKLNDLTYHCKSPKFNLHQAQKIPEGFKMTVLTPKWGIP